MKVIESVPADRVIVRDGKVVLYEQWTLFKHQPLKVMTIERRGNEYRFSAGDSAPESVKVGPLDSITRMFDSIRDARIHALFSFRHVPTPDELRAIGFKENIEVIIE